MKYKKIGKAIGDLIANYEDAIHTDFVYKPISYALYQTWKKWDEKEEPRKTKDRHEKEQKTDKLKGEEE